jgi:O-antigen/teichoic acid export membrane protein
MAGTIILYLFSRKYLLHKFNPSISRIKELIGYGGYIFGSSVLSSVFSNLDQLLTAYFLLPSSVAYYNAAKRINGFIDIPTYAAAEIVFPKMSQASADEGIGKVKSIYEKMISLLLCLIIPAAILVILLPKLIIFILAGADYASAALILQIYMIISVIGTLQHQAATSMDSIGKTRLSFFTNLTSFIIKLTITYFCLRHLGLYGAAIGALITSVITGFVWYFLMKREVGFSIAVVPQHMKFYYSLAYKNLKSAFKRA